MNCKVCGKEIPENAEYCDICEKARVSRPKKAFKVTIPLDDEYEAAPEAEEEKKDAPENIQETEEKTEITEAKEADGKEEPSSDGKKEEEATEKFLSGEPFEENLFINEEKEILLAEVQLEAEEEKKRKAAEKAARLKKQQLEKKHKRVVVRMRIFVCLCLAVMVGLLAVSLKTDIFQSQGKDNTVVLSSFSEEEKAEFKAFIEKYSVLFESGYNSDVAVSPDYIGKMMPSCENGLYAGVFKKAELITDVQDPAGRFSLSEGGYCKVSQKKVAAILESLNLAVLNDANCENHYYYNGDYYFRAEKGGGRKQYNIEITDSKKTADGHYYVTCSLGEDGTIYVLADKNKNGDYVILEISHEPLYSPMGTRNEIIRENSLSYKNERKIIEVRTSKNVLFARYVVVYPSFETEGKTETLIESLYAEKISAYEAEKENADKLYKKYIKKGGLKENLPIYVNLTVSVTYNENGYFSIVERTAACDHLSHSELSSEVTFPTVTFEGYSFEIQSGEFIRKDDVLGKDYLSVQSQLFRNYYDYSSEEAVSDSQGLGEAIYSSAWALEKDGVRFCYQDKNGVYEKIILPYKDLQGSLKYNG